MKLWERLSDTLKMIVMGAVVLAILLLVFQVRSCQDAKRAAVQGKVDAAQGGAQTNSARDAINTQSEVNRNEVQSRDLDRNNAEEIRNAEGADAPIAGPVRDAGLLALCRRPSYRDSERCRLLRAGSP